MLFKTSKDQQEAASLARCLQPAEVENGKAKFQLNVFGRGVTHRTEPTPGSVLPAGPAVDFRQVLAPFVTSQRANL